jgi:pimeloyl-ACP methyl ester carboxylesterase
VVFAVLPATGQRKGMFVTATGGPGTSGLSAKDSYTAGFDPSIPRRFDIVFFDQRGVGASGGLTCPEAAVTFYQAGMLAETPAQEAALKQAAHTFADDCVAEMGTPSILPYLGTAQAVEDLEYFRTLMQDDKLWLYGESARPSLASSA